MEIKLTEDFKFRYVDTELEEEEIEQLTKEQWKALYCYAVRRDAPFKKSPWSAFKTIMGFGKDKKEVLK